MASAIWPQGGWPSDTTLGHLDWRALVEASAASEGPRWPLGLRPAELPPLHAVVAAQTGCFFQTGCRALAVLSTAWAAELGLASLPDSAAVPMDLGGLGLHFYPCAFGPSPAEAARALEALASARLLHGDWVSLDELALSFVQLTRLRLGPRAWIAP